MIKLELSETKFQWVSPGGDKAESAEDTAKRAKTLPAQVLHGSYHTPEGQVHEGDIGVLRYTVPNERKEVKFLSIGMDKVTLRNSVLLLPEVRAAWQQEALADIIGVPKSVLAILFTSSEQDLKKLLQISTRMRISWREEELVFLATTIPVAALKGIAFPPRLVADLRKLGAVK